MGIVLYELVTGTHPLAPMDKGRLAEALSSDAPMPRLRAARAQRPGTIGRNQSRRRAPGHGRGGQDRAGVERRGTPRPRVLTGHQAAVYSVSFSPDGKRLLSGSVDRTARLGTLDGTTEPPAQPIVFAGHAGPVSSALFDPTGTIACPRPCAASS